MTLLRRSRWMTFGTAAAVVLAVAGYGCGAQIHGRGPRPLARHAPASVPKETTHRTRKANEPLIPAPAAKRTVPAHPHPAPRPVAPTTPRPVAPSTPPPSRPPAAKTEHDGTPSPPPSPSPSSGGLSAEDWNDICAGGAVCDPDTGITNSGPGDDSGGL
jgi:hypothetical protein